MLAPPKGNLDFVREQLRQQRIMIENYESEMTDYAMRSSPLDAEISEGHADWYLVNAFPGDDLRAMRYLARRRFGVFRPMQQKTDKQGNKVQGLEAVFPGWLFVYVWDVGKLHGRILACPGVMAILCDPVSGKPMPVNQPDKKTGEPFIDKLRALGWVYKDNAPRLERHSPIRYAAAPKATNTYMPRRPAPKERKQLDKLKKQFKAMGLEWDQATWQHANELAPHLRIALLQRTIANMLPVVG